MLPSSNAPAAALQGLQNCRQQPKVMVGAAQPCRQSSSASTQPSLAQKSTARCLLAQPMKPWMQTFPICLIWRSRRSQARMPPEPCACVTRSLCNRGHVQRLGRRGHLVAGPGPLRGLCGHAAIPCHPEGYNQTAQAIGSQTGDLFRPAWVWSWRGESAETPVPQSREARSIPCQGLPVRLHDPEAPAGNQSTNLCCPRTRTAPDHYLHLPEYRAAGCVRTAACFAHRQPAPAFLKSWSLQLMHSLLCTGSVQSEWRARGIFEQGCQGDGGCV